MSIRGLLLIDAHGSNCQVAVFVAAVVPLRYHPAMAINVRLSEAEEAVLESLARRAGRSKNDIIRIALVEKAARDEHRERVDASLDWALDRYGDVVRRLGEA